MAVLIDLIKSSAAAMVVVILISGCGCLCAIFPRSKPLLYADARRDIGDLSLKVLWPCLTVASIGPSIHIEHLAAVAELLIWCLLVVGFAAALSYATAKALRLNTVSSAAFILAGSFGNAGALPMLMMDTLCSQPVVLEHMVDQGECVEISFAFIIVFTIAWTMIMFGIAVPLMKHVLSNNDSQSATGCGGTDEKPKIGVVDAAPSSIELLLTAGSSDNGDDGGNLVFQSTPRAEEMTTGKVQRELTAPLTICKQLMVTMTQSPPVVSCYVGLFVGLVRPLSDALFTGSGFLASVGRALGTIGDAGVSIMTMVMGAALFYKPPPPPLPEMPPRRQTSDGPQEVALQPESPTAAVGEKAYNTYKFSPRKASNVTTREIFAMCILKLVLIPAVGFAFTWLAMKYGMFGSKPLDGLRALVVCLEWAVPSAQTCIVVMVTLQHHELAKNMAVLYLFMYPLSMISLTAWTSFALYLVEQHIWDSR